MVDKFKQEEKYERQRIEEPDKTGSALIKYVFITIITIAILAFFAFYVIPMIGDLGDQDGGQETDDSNGIDIEITDDDGDSDNGGSDTGDGSEDSGGEDEG